MVYWSKGFNGMSKLWLLLFCKLWYNFLTGDRKYLSNNKKNDNLRAVESLLRESILACDLKFP